MKPPSPPISTQHPSEHICQLELVHCVAPAVTQVSQPETPVATGLAGDDEATGAIAVLEAAADSVATWGAEDKDDATGVAEATNGAAEALDAAEDALAAGAEPEPAAGWSGTASSLFPPKMDIDCLRSGKLAHCPLFWAPETVTGAQFIYVSPVVLAFHIHANVAAPFGIAACIGTLKARIQPVSVESGSAQWLLGASG